MRLKNFLKYYDARLQDRKFLYDLVEMVDEEVGDARTIGIRMGRIQRESDITSRLLSALKEDTEPSSVPFNLERWRTNKE